MRSRRCRSIMFDLSCHNFNFCKRLHNKSFDVSNRIIGTFLEYIKAAYNDIGWRIKGNWWIDELLTKFWSLMFSFVTTNESSSETRRRWNETLNQMFCLLDKFPRWVLSSITNDYAGEKLILFIMLWAMFVCWNSSVR